MKEKDWDYVFQANKILSCSYVDPLTRQILRAPHAGLFGKLTGCSKDWLSVL